MGEGHHLIAHRGRLSAELSRARRAAGLTQREVAHALGWSLSKMIRIEAGQVGVSQTDATALLAHYGVTNPDRVADVVALTRHSRRQPLGVYRDVLHPEYLVFLGFESHASQLRQFEPLVIPGLLQTPGYARAIIRAVARPDTPPQTVDRQIQARLARQALLERPNPPTMYFIIDETALRRWVGTRAGQADVLHEQIEHLRTLAKRPEITIQVLPFRHGPHFGMMGPFALLEFSDAQDPDVLYLETGRPNLLIRDRPDQISLYRDVFTDLQRHASAPDSLDDVLDAVSRDLPA